MKTMLVSQTMDHAASTAAQDFRVKYVVRKVTNSVTPKLNDELTPDQLHLYCEDEDWNVTICND